MPFEKLPGSTESPALSAETPTTVENGDYWFALIDENAAANFLDLTTRTIQAYRHEEPTADGRRLSSRIASGVGRA